MISKIRILLRVYELISREYPGSMSSSEILSSLAEVVNHCHCQPLSLSTITIVNHCQLDIHWHHNHDCHKISRETPCTMPMIGILLLSTSFLESQQFSVRRKQSWLNLFLRIWKIQEDDLVRLFLQHWRHLWPLPGNECHIHCWVHLLVHCAPWRKL